MLTIDEDVERFNSETASYGYFEQRAHFSKDLFKECAKFLLSFVKAFEVSESPQ